VEEREFEELIADTLEEALLALSDAVIELREKGINAKMFYSARDGVLVVLCERPEEYDNP